MHYVEIAKGSPRNRGLLIVKTELGSHINTNEPLYRSMYLYDNDAIEYSNKKGSIANYFGTRYIDKILIDTRGIIDPTIANNLNLVFRGLGRGQ